MKFFNGLKKIYFVIAIALWPCIMTIPMYLYNSGAWWELALLLVGALVLYLVLPYYMVYLELGAAIGRLTDGKWRTRSEKRMGFFTSASAVLLVVTTTGMLTRIFTPLNFLTNFMPYEIIFYTHWAAVALQLVLWIVAAAVYKKRLPLREIWAYKSVRIPVILLFLVALALGAVVLCINAHGGLGLAPGGVPDPFA